MRNKIQTLSFDQSDFTITISGVLITEKNIKEEAGIVSVDGSNRPGFQFVYRTTAASLDIQVDGPHGGV